MRLPAVLLAVAACGGAGGLPAPEAPSPPPPAAARTPTSKAAPASATFGPIGLGAAYPAAAGDAAALVEAAFAGVPVPAQRPDYALIGVILPHGALSDAGPAAALGWQVLRREPVERVVLLIPAGLRTPGHVATAVADRWTGPWGSAPLDRDLAGRLVADHDIIRDDPGLLASVPEAEAHLPLLMRVAGGARLLPLLVGDDTAGLPHRLAAALLESVPMGRGTVLCALGNLPAEAGKEALSSLDPAAPRALVREGRLASGPLGAVSVLLDVGRALAADGPRPLSEGPVGASFAVLAPVARYADLPFRAPLPPDPPLPGWSGKVEADLLEVARKTVVGAVAMGYEPQFPIGAEGPLSRPSGAFVSLRAGTFRSVGGALDSGQPLWQAVRAAAGDAVRKARPPLDRRDLAALEVEVTIPGPASPLDDPAKALPGRDGVVASRPVAGGRDDAGGDGATAETVILPQAATSLAWDAPTLLRHACRAAGLPPECRRDPAVKWSRFQAVVFRNDPAAPAPPPPESGPGRRPDPVEGGRPLPRPAH